MVNLRRSLNAERAEFAETFHAENAEPRRCAEAGHHSAAGGCRPPCVRHIDREAARKHKRLRHVSAFVFPCRLSIDAARSAPHRRAVRGISLRVTRPLRVLCVSPLRALCCPLPRRQDNSGQPPDPEIGPMLQVCPLTASARQRSAYGISSRRRASWLDGRIRS